MIERAVIPNEVRDLANGLELRDFSRVYHHLRRSSPHDLFFGRFNASPFPNGRANVNTYHSPLDDLTEKDSLPVISQSPSTPIPYPAVRLGQSAPICAICGPSNE
jgi:hypothetical protein